MTSFDNYKLLDHTGKVIAVGTQDQMFSFLKHYVPDGRYRIVGHELKLHCVRKDGIVGPDPDGVCLEARTKPITLGELLEPLDSPSSDSELEADDDQ